MVSGGHNLAGNQVWVKIRDDGPGIEESRRNKIFEPFHTSKETGTGLGLAITRKLVEAHGGTITVQPALPTGTEFELNFNVEPA